METNNSNLSNFENHNFNDRKDLSAYLKATAVTVALIAGPIIFLFAHYNAFPGSINILIKHIAAIESLALFGSFLAGTIIYLVCHHNKQKKELQDRLGAAIDSKDISEVRVLLYQGADLKYFSPDKKTVFDCLKSEEPSVENHEAWLQWKNESGERELLKAAVQEKMGDLEKRWCSRHNLNLL